MARFRIAAATIVLLFSTGAKMANALGETKYVSNSPGLGDFVLAANGQAAPLVVSEQDWPGVVRAVGDLSQDVGRVTGHDAPVVKDKAAAGDEVVLIGTIGRSPLIDCAGAKAQAGCERDRGPVGVGGDDRGGAADAGGAAGVGDCGRG